MQRTGLGRARVEKFQSAPGLEAGRCRSDRRLMDAFYKFQSAPGLEAGRCRAGGRGRCAVAEGFNPRPALRPGDAPTPPRHRAGCASFNPRPALRPGDATRDGMPAASSTVFQSAPGLEAGRCMVETAYKRKGLLRFQSAPGLEAGRCFLD